MGFLSNVIDFLIGETQANQLAEALRSGEHIDEVWNIRGAKVYHIQNPKDGKEWTANRHAAPHCGGAGATNPLTELTPPFDYQHYTARVYNSDPQQMADGFNSQVGHYEGSTYVMSPQEIEELVNKL